MNLLRIIFYGAKVLTGDKYRSTGGKDQTFFQKCEDLSTHFFIMMLPLAVICGLPVFILVKFYFVQTTIVSLGCSAGLLFSFSCFIFGVIESFCLFSLVGLAFLLGCLGH